MGRLRNALVSLAVTIMITDLVLVGLACVPEAQQAQNVATSGFAVQTGTSAGPAVSLAGGGGVSMVQPAFLGGFFKWVRNCARGYIGGNQNCRRKCRNFQSRDCNAADD